MFKIEITREGHLMGSKVLSEGELIAGRDPHCDVLLESEHVSRRHARIAYRNGRLLIEDLHSLNGIFVDGCKVARRSLRVGEIVDIGDFSLRVAEESTDPPEGANRSYAFLRGKRVAMFLLFSVVLAAGLPAIWRLVLSEDDPIPQDDSQRPITQPSPADTLEAREKLRDIRQEVAALLKKNDRKALLEKKKALLALQNRYPGLLDFEFIHLLIDNRLQQEQNAVPTKTFRAASPSGRKARRKFAASRPRAKQGPIQPVLHAATPISGRATPVIARSESQKHALSPSPRIAAKKETTALRKPLQSHVATRTKKPPLTSDRMKEAERIYWQAYRIMAYKNRKALLKAFVLFKKVQEVAPDKNFEFYRKAGEKIDSIKMALM